MVLIIGAAFCILLLFSGVLRVITLGLFGLIGAGGALLIGIFIWGLFTQGYENAQQAQEHEPTAADYRAAQAAVAKATGKPCGYSCKVMIAEQARSHDDD